MKDDMKTQQEVLNAINTMASLGALKITMSEEGVDLLHEALNNVYNYGDYEVEPNMVAYCSGIKFFKESDVR